MTAPLPVTGVCRWNLDCSDPATERVEVKALEIITTACKAHAQWHREWVDSTALNRGPEPEPECWCPDQLRGSPAAPAYCPAHGTPDQRGLEEV